MKDEERKRKKRGEKKEEYGRMWEDIEEYGRIWKRSQGICGQKKMPETVETTGKNRVFGGAEKRRKFVVNLWSTIFDNKKSGYYQRFAGRVRRIYYSANKKRWENGGRRIKNGGKAGGKKEELCG